MVLVLNTVIARRALLHVLPLAPLWRPFSSSATSISDPIFGRLRNQYYLFRPGETSFEAADIVDSNPINKGSSERGLTSKGREQVRRSAQALRALGVDSPTIWYDNGARAMQTADIISTELFVPRARMEPEFRWLEARGLGVLDGTSLRMTAEKVSSLHALPTTCSHPSSSSSPCAKAPLPAPPPLPSNLPNIPSPHKVRALDALDIDNRPEPGEDGTPSDSVNEIFSRLRNTVGMGSVGMGSVGMGSVEMGSVGMGSVGMGSVGMGSVVCGGIGRDGIGRVWWDRYGWDQ